MVSCSDVSLFVVIDSGCPEEDGSVSSSSDTDSCSVVTVKASIVGFTLADSVDIADVVESSFIFVLVGVIVVVVNGILAVSVVICVVVAVVDVLIVSVVIGVVGDGGGVAVVVVSISLVVASIICCDCRVVVIDVVRGGGGGVAVVDVLVVSVVIGVVGGGGGDVAVVAVSCSLDVASIICCDCRFVVIDAVGGGDGRGVAVVNFLVVSVVIGVVGVGGGDVAVVAVSCSLVVASIICCGCRVFDIDESLCVVFVVFVCVVSWF